MAVLAPSCVRCRSEINFRWPRRDHGSDGWIGNLAHQKKPSDHNPNKRGVVDAIDIDVDGIDCAWLVAMLIRHPSTNYVIWNGKIWSRSHGFVARIYTGADKHRTHIHLSILQTVAAENSTRTWGIAGIVVVPVVHPVPAPRPAPESGPVEGTWVQRLAKSLPVLKAPLSSRRSVRKVQALVNVASGNPLTEDGGFGPKTTAAVRGFQRAYGLADDGVVGAKTWGALIGNLRTLRRGDNAVEVRRLQALINVYGYNIREDGVFGGGTQSAVEAFQSRTGLRRDGVAGPMTYTALLTR